MRKFMTVVSVAAVAVFSASCSSHDGVNASGDVLGVAGVVGPSAFTEARGGGGGGKGGGKGGGGTTSPDGGGGGSLSLVMAVDNNGNQKPNWNDTITFNVSTSATTEPHVTLSCSQGGNVVLGATTGFYASYPWPWTNFMKLSTQSWTGGAADCTAQLYYVNGTSTVNLTSITFHVDA